MSDGVKYIKVPSPVPIFATMGDNPTAVVRMEGAQPGPNGEIPQMTVDLRRIILWALEHEQFSRTTQENRRIGDKLADWAETLKTGMVVSIAESWLTLLVKALDTRATIPWPRWIVRQCRTLFAALEDDVKDKADAFDGPGPSNGTSHEPDVRDAVDSQYQEHRG